MNKYLKSISPLLLITSMLLGSPFFAYHLSAQGNLLVTPKRIVFEGNKRSEEINLANIGKDTTTFVISFIQVKMNEDGTFEKITQPDSAQFFADKNIRFFPRTVTLGPGEAQTVKVQIIKNGDLKTGEYRSHLYFRANLPQKPLGEEVFDDKDSLVSVKLTPIFGISIPVIIRKGESTATVNISELRMEYKKDNENAVNITFNRNGNMSVYGDVFVDHISLLGKVTRVGVVKGMAVYSPNNIRKFHLKLDKSAPVNYHEGKLKVVYSDQSLKGISLAAGEILLN